MVKFKVVKKSEGETAAQREERERCEHNDRHLAEVRAAEKVRLRRAGVTKAWSDERDEQRAQNASGDAEKKRRAAAEREAAEAKAPKTEPGFEDVDDAEDETDQLEESRRMMSTMTNEQKAEVKKLVTDRIRTFLPATTDAAVVEAVAEQALDSVERALAEMAGKGTVEEPRPAWARDAFLDPSGTGPDNPAIVGDRYEVVQDVGIAPARKDPGFHSAGYALGGLSLAAPASFEAPTPAAMVGKSKDYVEVPKNQIWRGSQAYRPMTAIEKEIAKQHDGAAAEDGGWVALTGPGGSKRRRIERE